MKIEKKKNQSRLIFLIIFTFIPSAIILILVNFGQFDSSDYTSTDLLPTPTTVRLSGLSPSTLLEDVLYYEGKDINIQGRIVYGEKSCTNRVCQASDPCCGCNTDRDLILKDISTNLFKQSGEIRLFDHDRTSFCQKENDSCDYSCGNWQVGQVYEVTGSLVVVRPSGLTLSRGYLEYYIEVKDKKPIIMPTTTVKAPSFFKSSWDRYILPLIQQRNL